MLSYNQLKDRPRDFLAATGFTWGEFQQLLPAFQDAYAQRYPYELTRTGQTRQRRPGGGAKGVVQRFEAQLLCILVYQKTNPLPTMPAVQFALSQPQATYWRHQWRPVLQHALAALGPAPERDARRLATSLLALEGAPATALDGTERRRQRPTDAQWQQQPDSGKKQTHTEKNLLLGNETTRKVVYLGPPIVGRTHAKKAADEAKIPYPTNATLDKDTGFQGYEPDGVLTAQPQKSPKAARWGGGSASWRGCSRRGGW
jgi:Helix-turn-helix of DDE superfamily endonuclease